MRSIVLGAGRFGQSIAISLCENGHSVTLVDRDEDKLKACQARMDIAIEQGFAQDPRLLAKLLQEPTDFLLALTDDPNTNLVASAMAKMRANPTTIARLSECYFLDEKLDVARIFHVDYAVVPEILAQEQIAKIVFHHGLNSESFFHGNAVLRTFEIPKNCPLIGKSLSQINTQNSGFMIGLIARKKGKEQEIIFPHGNDSILQNDEITIIADANQITKVLQSFGLTHKMPKSVLIVGGTKTSITLARFLQKKKLSVRLVIPSYTEAHDVAKELEGVVVLYQPNMNYDFFQSEQIGKVDAFIACGDIEENNLAQSMYAKELGCEKVIALISDPISISLAKEQGIHHIISSKALSNDRILALTKGDKISAYFTLYDRRCELIELRVSHDSPIAGIPLSILGPKLPPDMLIAVIYDRGRFFIAQGSHILAPKNDIIVLSSPKHRKFLEKTLLQ